MKSRLPAIIGLAALAVVARSPCDAAFAGTDCKCRANGTNYEQGQIMCILGKLSQCQMNQNVPAWAVIAPDCPEVDLRQTPRPQNPQVGFLDR
jgi:hypothetical protein